MSKQKFLIGIDPDVDKSGFAMIQGNKLVVDTLIYFDLFDKFSEFSKMEVKPVVYVEKGSLNKSNWHAKKGYSQNYNAKIGENTGRNFEVANKIVEMCVYFGFKFFEIKPTQKKINSETFKKLTNSNIRTNQEERDAFMLIYGK